MTEISPRAVTLKEGMSIRRPASIIVWIRNELRVQDNLALWTATRDAGRVIPLVVLPQPDPYIAAAKLAVILDGIHDLRNELRGMGGDLFVRNGPPETALLRLISETGAGGVYCTRDYHPVAAAKDAATGARVTAEGKLWKVFEDRTIMEPGRVVKKSDGGPFTVFTPYRNAWRSLIPEIRPSLPDLREIRVPDVLPGDIPNRFTTGDHLPIEGGARAAGRAMLGFLNGGIGEYHRRRDYPGIDGTSRLSHHLAVGTLSPVALFNRLRNTQGESGTTGEGKESFINELIWREFYYQILDSFPHVAAESFHRDYDAVEWSDNPEKFLAWCAGETGFPVVDAAMRQLTTEGWMHNRGRMIVASFLTKDLHIDWRKGEEFFMKHLADGDPALNNGGWQWSAGTGNDAQPWFRIFNPVLQGKKFDPDGTYIRKYLPELAGVPAGYVHEPWAMPRHVQEQSGCRIGADYPSPIVDHAKERAETIMRYSVIKKGRMAEQGHS
jgi:deoxyribodipyrimidine photo-lyase